LPPFIDGSSKSGARRLRAAYSGRSAQSEVHERRVSPSLAAVTKP
jgi:hypothetical protein